MKVLILGNSGAGKSTIARAVSSKYNFPLCSMDDLVWENNVKRSHEKRIEILNEFLDGKENWVAEGMSHKTWMHQLYKTADIIFLVNTSNCVARFRIVKRHIKKKLGFEVGHKQTWKDVKGLLKIQENYRKNIIPEIEENVKNFGKNIIYIKKKEQAFKNIDNLYPILK